MKRYYIKTFWCAMNQADSEKINMILLQSWFVLTNDWKTADLIIFNTCSVRQKWEDKVFWFIEEIYRENNIRLDKWKSTLIKVWITGCMVRKTWIDWKYLEEYKRDKNKSKTIITLNNSSEIFNNDDKLFPRNNWKLDFVLRIEDTKFIPLILTHVYWENIGTEYKFDDYLKSKQLRENPYSATIIIQTWCDNYCTFCIVPYTRWKENSRNIEDIVSEAKDAVLWWAKEITLVWQNVNSYGKHFVDKKFWNEEKWKWNEWLWKSPFRELLEQLDTIDGLDRIRFTSSNPHDMTQDILDAHFDLNKTCNYLHFALQSWSNEMLKKMNRKHWYETFKTQVEYLRSRDPEFSISTDIIVWFSWETEEMFNDTVNAFRECEFDFTYNARYSVRKGTIASKIYPDDITNEDKASRWHKLNDELLKSITKRNTKLIWSIQEILIWSQKDDYFSWRTRNFKEVHVKWENLKIWDLVKVKITEVERYVLNWELV